jgi:hypothetical protein
LAVNLTRLDYVPILCGSIEELPLVFAELDAANRAHSLSSRAAELDSVEAETASLRAYAMTLKSPKRTGPWTALSPDSGNRAGCIVEAGYP